MVIYSQSPSENTDLLNSEDEFLRRGFSTSAKTIGAFQTSSSSTTAHILHPCPLLIGAITTASSGDFYPYSPGYYDKSTPCHRKFIDPKHNYAVFECETLSGGAFNLDFTYPKIKTEPKAVTLAWTNSGKVLDTENKTVGGIVTKVGSNQFIGIVGEKGEIIAVEELKEAYNEAVWPVAKLYDFKIRGKYFTYFREYEVKKELKPSGLDGTRFRHIEGNVYFSLYRARAWNFIKRIFGYGNN
jgi:hypothetical protein